MKDVLKKSMILASASAMLAGMTACGPAIPFGPQGQALGNRVGAFNNGPVRTNGKKWTYLIHLAGDNNLYPFALGDVNEMEAGLAKNPAAAAEIDVIVLFDGTPTGDSKILRIKPDAMNSKIVSEVIDDKGAVIPPSKEIDSGSAEVATKFVDWATKNFPAQYNAHIIWNHGAGIGVRNRAASPEFGGAGDFFETVIGSGLPTRAGASKMFASDDHGTEMHMSDVMKFMAPGVRNLGRPFDVVGFDACLMQHIETAYQYKGLANVLIASEELEPGEGWNYIDVVGAMAQNPNINPAQLGKAQVDSFVKFYQATGDDATLSAVDVNAVVSTFVPALNELAGELKAALPTDKAAIATARNNTQTFYNRNAADLGDFLRKFSANSRNPRVGAASAKVQQAMGKVLIAEGHTGSGVQGATGIQMYFPTATMNFNKKYDDINHLRFAETRGWSDFLKAFTAK